MKRSVCCMQTTKVLILCFLIFFFCYWALQAIFKLKSPPISTTVEFRFGDDNLGHFELPTLSICPESFMRMMPDKLIKKCNLTIGADKPYSYLSAAKQCWHAYESFTAMMDDITPKITDMSMYLGINAAGENVIGSAGNDLEKYWDLTLFRKGICYTFDPKIHGVDPVEYPRAERVGETKNEILITLLFDFNKLYHGNASDKGLALVVHGSKKTLLEEINGNSVFVVKAGTWTEIQFSRRVIKAISREGKPCLQQEKEYFHCRHHQIDQAFVQRYNCKYPWMDRDFQNPIYQDCPWNRTRIQQMEDDYRCLISWNKGCSKDLKLVPDCSKYPACYRSLYSLETKYQGNFSKTESLFANVQLNLVKPEVTYIEDHEVYDLQSFIGEVGGTLGLMLGLSFSSVLDVMDLMAAKLFYSVDK